MVEETQLVYAVIGGIGLPELLIIFFLALLIFGGKRLPEVARSMGQAMRAFKDEANKLRSEVELEAEKEKSTPTTAKEGEKKEPVGQATGEAQKPSEPKSSS
jgi:sec-independent protein translocase protein TatA